MQRLKFSTYYITLDWTEEPNMCFVWIYIWPTTINPGEGKGYLLQYSGLEKSMDCVCVVHGVTKSQTQLSDFHFTTLIKGTCIEGVWEFIASGQFPCSGSVVWAFSADSCWAGCLVPVTKSRGLLSCSFLIVGKELQTLFEEGGSEDLVIKTKEGKKILGALRDEKKNFFYHSVEILLPTLDCNPKLMINNIDDKINIFRLMNFRVIFLGFIGRLCWRIERSAISRLRIMFCLADFLRT